MTSNAPTSPEAEATVLGSCLADVDAIVFVADVVSPVDFTVPIHRWLAEALWKCYDNKQPPTIAAIIDRLRSGGRWAERTSKNHVSMADIDAVLNATTATDLKFVVHNAQLVRDASFRRNGHTQLSSAASLFYDSELQPDELQKRVLTTVGQVFDAYGKRDASLTSIGEIERDRLKTLDVNSLPGVSCGLTWLDELTGGFLPSESWVVAAPYKKRKTTLALNMALSAATRGTPVSVFTVGDSSRDATYRKLLAMVMTATMIAHEPIPKTIQLRPVGRDDLRISGRALQYKLRDEYYIKLKAECEAELEKLPLRLYDGMDMIGSLSECGRVLRRDVAVHGTRVFFYDYAQAAQCGQNDYERTMRFASWMQGLVGELGLTGITLSQLSEEGVRDTMPSYSPRTKGGGSLAAMANVLLMSDYNSPYLTVTLKLARDSAMGDKATHTLNPASGLILDPGIGAEGN